MIYLTYLTPRVRLIALSICAAVAFVCAIVLAVGYAVNAGYETTQGTVIGNNSRPTRSAEGPKARVCPRIEFRDHEQVTREFTAFDACADTESFKVGQRVTVYFQKSDPAYPSTTATDELFNTMIAALVVGLVSLIGALVVRRRQRRA
mgnify:CR=1 FL=1